MSAVLKFPTPEVSVFILANRSTMEVVYGLEIGIVDVRRVLLDGREITQKVTMGEMEDLVRACVQDATWRKELRQ